MLIVIQKYFTCEVHFQKFYMYHFKLLLHFTGKKLIDIPFYLFRSLEKMADKVQGRPKRNETSIFHHGLMQLLVLEELSKLNRDWALFLFMNGYELDVLSPRKVSKLKASSSKREMNATTELEGDQHEGLKVTDSLNRQSKDKEETIKQIKGKDKDIEH